MCALFLYLDLRKFVRVAIASFSNKTITTDSPFYFFFFWISSSISSPQVKSIFWQYLRFNIESFFNIDNRWGFVMKMNWLWKSHSHLILLICFSVNKFLSSLRMLLMISYKLLAVWDLPWCLQWFSYLNFGGKVVITWKWFYAVTIISHNAPMAILSSLVSMVAFLFYWTQNDTLVGKFIL